MSEPDNSLHHKRNDSWSSYSSEENEDDRNSSFGYINFSEIQDNRETSPFEESEDEDKFGYIPIPSELTENITESNFETSINEMDHKFEAEFLFEKIQISIKEEKQQKEEETEKLKRESMERFDKNYQEELIKGLDSNQTNNNSSLNTTLSQGREKISFISFLNLQIN